jgi:protein-tyrosine-phosphatase
MSGVPEELHITLQPIHVNTYKILFVCTNNTATSPLAAAMFNSMSLAQTYPHHTVGESAGCYSGALPRPADRRIRTLAESRGLSLDDHLSRDITHSDLDLYEVILAMDHETFTFIRFMIKERGTEEDVYLKKLKRFVEFFGDESLVSIPNPVLGEEVFEESYRMIERGIAQLWIDLNKGAVIIEKRVIKATPLKLGKESTTTPER